MVNGTYNICIPVFNEEENIHQLIEKTKNFIKDKEQNFNIIVYDDGSTDKTLEILESFKDITVLKGVENNGLGHAIQKLLDFSVKIEVDGIFKIDGDNQMEINEIENFFKFPNFDSSDVIYGNRFNKKLKYKMPLFRKLGSTFFKYLLKIFSINVSDPTNGFIYLSKKYLQNYKILGSYNAAQQILLDAKLRNLNIHEVDVTINSRTTGLSFIGIKYPVIVISNLLALLVYRKTTRYLISPGIIIFLGGIILFIFNIISWIIGTKTTIISDNILILMIIVGLQLAISGFLLETYKNNREK